VKLVQQMLGHKSATMTLDQYATYSVIAWTLRRMR
jgi:integrase